MKQIFLPMLSIGLVLVMLLLSACEGVITSGQAFSEVCTTVVLTLKAANTKTVHARTIDSSIDCNQTVQVANALASGNRLPEGWNCQVASLAAETVLLTDGTQFSIWAYCTTQSVLRVNAAQIIFDEA